VIGLLTPIGLAALAALVVPILIHLVRRSERKRVDFAALRWLNERSRPRKQIRLHERCLLVLRMLLITMLALLLAQPVWRSSGMPGARWVGVASGVDVAAARAAVPDATQEWHWLAPGFPLIDSGASPPVSGLSSQIRELDAVLPANTPLTLVVPEVLQGLDAERLQLRHDVAWVIRPGNSVASTSTHVPSPAHISVRYDAQGESELPVIRAITQAWAVAGFKSMLDIAAGSVPIPKDADLVFWMAGAPDEAALKWIEDGGTLVQSKVAKPEGSIALVDDLQGDASILFERRQGRGRWLAFPAALTLEALPALRQPEFPTRLRRLLLPAPPPPDEAPAAAFKPGVLEGVKQGVATPLTDWLAVLAALLFLAERWLASGARRVVE